MISVSDFEKVEIRAGTVVEAKINKKSRNPAYAITIDFGEEIGRKKSSAQITALYSPEDLIGRQVLFSLSKDTVCSFMEIFPTMKPYSINSFLYANKE